MDYKVTDEERNLGLLTHVLGLFFGFVPSLIIYFIKKDESEYLKKLTTEALNFQITYIIYSFGYAIFSSIFDVITFGFGLIITIPLMFILLGAFYVFGILAAIDAHKGKIYNFPFIIRLIK